MGNYVLVTGGAGYVGSHTTRLLLDSGFNVVVLDNLSTGHRAAVDRRAAFVEADLLDRSRVADVFATYPIEGIFHFASYTLVGESMEKPWLYLRDNLLAASNLLEVSVQHGAKRFVLSSTANLFDQADEIPIKAESRIVPGSPYGESKYAIERMLSWMHRLYGLTHTCLRYFNASGAHPDGSLGEDHTPETHLIPIVLQAALGQRSHITVYGDDYDTPDGTNVRDFVHVLDLADAHLRAYDAMQDGQCRRYNLGSGSGFSVRQVIDQARAVTGIDIPYQIGPRRPGDPPALVADSTAIKRELGWSPRYSDLETVLETAWNWHRANPRGYT
jgi:UDP-glucose 4-epimerase